MFVALCSVHPDDSRQISRDTRELVPRLSALAPIRISARSPKTERESDDESQRADHGTLDSEIEGTQLGDTCDRGREQGYEQDLQPHPGEHGTFQAQAIRYVVGLQGVIVTSQHFDDTSKTEICCTTRSCLRECQATGENVGFRSGHLGGLAHSSGTPLLD